MGSAPGAAVLSPESVHVRPPGEDPLEVLYLREREKLMVIPTGTAQDWVLACLREARAEVELPSGGRREGHVGFLSAPEEVRRVREAFRRKYGEDVWRSHLERGTKVLVIDLERPPGPPRDRLDLLRQEFDAIATRYTETNLSNPMAARLKRRSLDRMRALFRGRDPLLEVGCGTGLETVPLLEAGHRIMAIDLSPVMLEVARERAASVAAEERLTARVGRLADLSQVLGDLPTGHFQGAYSTFGAVDLEEDLSSAGRTLGRVLGPGAPLFLAVLNPRALAPPLFALAAGRPREVAARWRATVPAGSIGNTLDLHPRAPRTLGRLLGDRFFLEKVEAASVLAPPWYSPRLLSRFSAQAIGAFARWDDRLVRTWPFDQLGEWSFLTFRRSGTPVPDGPDP